MGHNISSIIDACCDTIVVVSYCLCMFVLSKKINLIHMNMNMTARVRHSLEAMF